MAERDNARERQANQREGTPPAQVPGDAESPPKGKASETIREAVRHTDPTEPTQAARDR
jgi:hypothetical protein